VKPNRLFFGVLTVGAIAMFAVTQAAGVEPEATPFSMLVSTSAAGLELRCTSGCGWTTLQHACHENAPCWVKVDERGFEGQPAAGSQPGDKPFRILITVGGAGFSMQCKSGCAWKSLSYRCGPTGSCTATVDKDGVHGPDLPTQ
jgi:hypothetical protein